MAFHNTRLPEDVEKGALGGPQFSTNILELSAGNEKRNKVWSRTRGVWDVGYGVDTKEELEDVIAFFYARQGRLNGFRFKDWSDYRVGDNPSSTPQEIGAGDGSTVAFQVVKRYVSGDYFFDRVITRLVSGTLRVFLDGVEKSTPADYSVNIDTGVITFVLPPAADVSVQSICEFDVPVRFSSDMLDVRALRDDVITMPEIPIVEIKERPQAVTSGSTTGFFPDPIENEWTLNRLAMQSFDVSAQESATQGMYITPSGIKVIYIGSNTDSVRELNLTTPFDLTTASVGGSFSVAAQETGPTGVFLRGDGTKMYVTGETTGSAVYEYNLSAAFDVTSASFVQSLSVSAQDTNPKGVFLRDDGLKMYVVGSQNASIYEYNLSTPWDISTAAFSQSKSISAQDTTPEGVYIKSDGLRMWAVGSQNDDVYEYDLSTAWDITSATFNSNILDIKHDTLVKGLWFDTSGTYIYTITQTANTIWRYAL